MKTFSALVIGATGNIGSSLCRKIKEIPGCRIAGTLTRQTGLVIDPGTSREKNVPVESPFDLSQEFLETIDVVFLAIPSNQGMFAASCIRFFSNCGINVVTCEKAALSCHFDDVQPYLKKVGYSATVGGGTRMLHILKDRLRTPFSIRIYLILNGTLNYIFSGVSNGKTLGEAVRDAIRMKFAEPGLTEPMDVLKAEIGDTAMKAAVTYNLCLANDVFLDARDIKIDEITSAQGMFLQQNASEFRYIVSFKRSAEDISSFDHEVIGGFRHEIGGWHIVAGFFRTNSPVFKGRLPDDVNGTMITVEGKDGINGCYELAKGPVAGPDETASAMITDAFAVIE